MKKLILIVLTSFLIHSCSKNDDANSTNQYLPELNFDTGSTINTNLSQYNNLLYPGNHVIIESYGLNGIVVINDGISYSAFELSDPNHALQSCSKLNVEGGLAICGCPDNNEYHISTGQANVGTTGQYVLKRYYTEVSGTIIRVYNN